MNSGVDLGAPEGDTTVFAIREIDTGVYISGVTRGHYEGGKWHLLCSCGNEFEQDTFDCSHVGKPCPKCFPGVTRKIRFICKNDIDDVAPNVIVDN